MSDVLYIEFLYEAQDAAEVAHEVGKAFGVDPETTDLADGESVQVTVGSDDGEFFGELRLFASGREDHTFAPGAVTSVEVEVVADVLRWTDDLTGKIGGLIENIAEVYLDPGIAPAYVYGLAPGHAEMIWSGKRELPVTETDLEANRIRHPTWLMLFPPAMVETHGREFLLEAPVWRTEELDDGAVLLVAEENPMELATLDPLYDYFDLTPPE